MKLRFSHGHLQFLTPSNALSKVRSSFLFGLIQLSESLSFSLVSLFYSFYFYFFWVLLFSLDSIPSRSFWSRHKRKIFVSLGVLGSGYALYKLYDAHRKRIFDLDKELESQREVDELIKTQYDLFLKKFIYLLLFLVAQNLNLLFLLWVGCNPILKTFREFRIQ